MDGLKHPVGDQTPNVYWRRRVSVIVVIVLLGLLAWWVISALSADAGDATPGAQPDATTSPSPSEVTSADPGRPCTDTDITVATGPKDAVFASDEVPTFAVSVTSVSDTPCMVDPTTSSKIVITSGDEKWFDSSTCKDYSVYDAEKFLLEPGAKKKLEATWNNGRDDAGCPSDDKPSATAGYYWVTATVQGVSADKLQFEVR